VVGHPKTDNDDVERATHIGNPTVVVVGIPKPDDGVERARSPTLRANYRCLESGSTVRFYVESIWAIEWNGSQATTLMWMI
jgi:hypothetical protein